MKLKMVLGRSCRKSVLFVLFLSSLSSTGVASSSFWEDDAGLLPIEKSNINQSLIDELFNPLPRINGDRKRESGSQGGNSNSWYPNVITTVPGIKKSTVKDEFKCNLFENVPYEDILSALNALNQAVSSPACGGESKLGVQGIVTSNKTIADAMKDLRGYVENPDSILPENTAEIATKVDLAIRAVATIANSFAQSDFLNKDCRNAMSAGKVASSISQLINGLTPYALMAASMTTGGAAAVPYIVGGSIVTDAIGSMSKIIDENGVKVEQPEVRRAIVENTCQFIRLDQKYKFLVKSRVEQINKITTDLTSSQRFFTAKINGFPGKENGLSGRKGTLEKLLNEINQNISAARSQLELDMQFLNGTADDLKICQLGVQLNAMARDKSSYVSNMLSSLDKALMVYGSNPVAQARALKDSGALAMKELRSVEQSRFSGKVNYRKCADTTKSFIETIDKSATLAKDLVKLAQESLEKGLKGNKEYSLYKARLMALSQKQTQAQRVTDSLDKLQAYATTIAQSEINSEMDRLRKGLFGNSYMGLVSSPVLKWFEHVNGLHTADMSRFKEGLMSLQVRAFQMTPSGKEFRSYPKYFAKNTKDSKDAQNLVQFNLQDLPLGTPEHDDVCRELQDVWNRWSSAIDYLAASDAFCNMLEPYVYDNRPEDENLVSMCRGYPGTSPKARRGKAILSTVAGMKTTLVQDKTRDWALFLQKKIEALNCTNHFSEDKSPEGNLPVESK